MSTDLDPDVRIPPDDQVPEDPEALLKLGARLFAEKDHKRAMEVYRKCADLGNPTAMFHLGTCLLKGIGVDRDEREANIWYRKSADLGNSSAMWCLGYHLQNGIGVQKDEREAVVWYRRSAHLGISGAMCALGVCLKKGIGVERDEEEAMEWYRKAGTAVAFWNLGILSAERDPSRAVRDLCRAYTLYTTEHDRAECIDQIKNLMKTDLQLEVLQTLVHLERENHELRTEVEELRTEVEFRPGGAGYERARTEFLDQSRRLGSLEPGSEN